MYLFLLRSVLATLAMGVIYGVWVWYYFSGHSFGGGFAAPAAAGAVLLAFLVYGAIGIPTLAAGVAVWGAQEKRLRLGALSFLVSLGVYFGMVIAAKQAFDFYWRSFGLPAEEQAMAEIQTRDDKMWKEAEKRQQVSLQEESRKAERARWYDTFGFNFLLNQERWRMVVSGDGYVVFVPDYDKYSAQNLHSDPPQIHEFGRAVEISRLSSGGTPNPFVVYPASYRQTSQRRMSINGIPVIVTLYNISGMSQLITYAFGGDSADGILFRQYPYVAGSADTDYFTQVMMPSVTRSVP